VDYQTKQNKTKQNKTKQNKTKQNKFVIYKREKNCRRQIQKERITNFFKAFLAIRMFLEHLKDRPSSSSLSLILLSRISIPCLQ
jgi:hypothetical protein